MLLLGKIIFAVVAIDIFIIGLLVRRNKKDEKIK